MKGYAAPFIEEDDIKAVEKVLRSGHLTQGKVAKEFENKISEFTGAKYCVLFNSGSTALYAAYYALSLLYRMRQAIIPANTFCTTANAAIQNELGVHFVDIDETFNMDRKALPIDLDNEDVLIPVHYAGFFDMEKLYPMADIHGTKIIEDAAHAFGSKYSNGDRVGSCNYSDITCFSFHAIKNITTGEGGACTTNNEEIEKTLRTFQDCGRSYEHPFLKECVTPSLNFRMSDIQAALGISQLEKICKTMYMKEIIVKAYMANLPDSMIFGHYLMNTDINWHLFVIHHPNSALTIKKLEEKGWYVTKHYKPVYQHPFYQKSRNIGYCPNAEEHYRKCISLPLYPHLTKEEVLEICEIVKETL